MKFDIRQWSLLDLYKVRNRINFPVYQRGLVWDEERKRLLVDSVFRGIDIPKLYLQRIYEKNEWDCIDGHQRIQAIIGFFDGEFQYRGQFFEELTTSEKTIFEEYKLTITEISEIDDEEVRILFTRLQLGIPLNSGEKLNAINSNMGEFIKKLKSHRFITNISIPVRRFAKEQVCAQICNNSRYINKTGEFRNSKYEDLEYLYRTYADFNLNSETAYNILNIFNVLDNIFGLEASELTNRASVVSIYLFVEDLYIHNQLQGNENKIKDFYINFLNSLREETRLGIDATNRFLIAYASKVIQAADSKSAITDRHMKLHHAYNYFLLTGGIVDNS